MEKINKKKIWLKIILGIILIGLIFIAIFIYHQNNINTNEAVNENVITANNEQDPLAVEVENQEETKWEWQHDTPQNHNLDSNALNTLHNTLDTTNVYASVIVKDGYIVDEYYKEGYDENSVFTLQSTSKSITSALIGIAIDRGYIESVDVPISNYFPQILESDS